MVEAYKRYQKYECKNAELECGSPAEKYLFRYLKKAEKPVFLAEELKRILNAERLVVYGAGLIAEEVVYNLKSYEILVDYIAVSNKENNPRDILGIEVKEIEELQEQYRNALVIIAVTEKYVAEILSLLQKLGFNNVITIKRKDGLC